MPAPPGEQADEFKFWLFMVFPLGGERVSSRDRAGEDSGEPRGLRKTTCGKLKDSFCLSDPGKGEGQGMSQSDGKNEIDSLLSEIRELEQTLETPADSGAESEETPRIVEASDEFLEEFKESAETVGVADDSPPESDMEATLASLRPEEPIGGALAEVLPPEAVPVAATGSSTALGEDASSEDLFSERNEIEKPATLRAVAPAPSARAPEGEQRETHAALPEDEGSLRMSLRGRMSLELCYESFDQRVTLSFGESFLTVSLQDGTEFKIPVAKKGSKRVKTAA